MAFIQACQYISHLYRRASRSTLSTRPQPDASEANLTEKKMRLHSISETVDLGVADQLLVQRSRKHTNTSSSEQGENLWLEAKETLIDIKSQSEDLERRSLSNPAVEILKSNRLTGSDLSSSRTPRPLCLVPAKRLRPSPRAQALQLEAKKSGELAPRQINNQSAFSEKSNTTVNHDPSKRSHSPITVPDIVIFENTIDPFSDNNALRRSSDGSSNLRSSQSTGNRDSSKELRSTEEKIFEKYKIRRMVTNRSQTESKSHRTSSDAASRRLLENASPARRDFARREFARSKALLAFNLSAPYFGLKTLTPLTSSIPTMDPPPLNQSGSLLHRIRTAKSTLSMRQKGSVRQKLRRMKTMAILSSQYRPGCLRGKSLEDLSRLGGESILSKLPPRYFPGALRLPTCIAATVNALLNFGTAVPFIHSETGNYDLANTLYSFYAGQVLGAEKLKDKINKTMRPIEIPLEHINAKGFGRADEHVHVVSTVLKQFLAEIPGGILGSMRLYSALEQIHKSDFSGDNCLHDPGKKDYLPGMMPTLAAKVRMIALATMALTTDAQLELICSIFGLLAVTVDESEVMKDFHDIHLHPGSKCERCEGLMDSIQLGEEFGHLLCGFEAATFELDCKTRPETRTAEATTLVIDLWKDISQQFCVWHLIGS